MHPFVRKVAIAAILLALAGMAGASQARSDVSIYVQHNWLNGYAAAEIGDLRPAPPPQVIIVVPEYSREHPRGSYYHVKERDERTYAAPRGRQVQSPRRFRPHASGYSW